MIPPAPSFDAQASAFDARAGIPETVRAQIARTVVEAGRAGPEDLLLEIGAGTGEIGIELCRLGIHYVGVDISRPMLDEFEKRLGSAGPETRARARLVVRDANLAWPVPDGGARAVFGSRSLHLLDSEHVANQMVRVAACGRAVLLVGRVGRSPDSVRSRMRAFMRHLVEKRGLEGRSGERGRNELASACVQRGATLLPERCVASFGVRESPARSLESWAEKPGLAGMALPEPEKSAILGELREWALQNFGALDTELDSREEYLLGGAAFDTENAGGLEDSTPIGP